MKKKSIYLYIYIYILTEIYINIYVENEHRHIHVYIYIFRCICIYTYVYTHIYIWIYIHIFIYTLNNENIHTSMNIEYFDLFFRILYSYVARKLTFEKEMLNLQNIIKNKQKRNSQNYSYCMKNWKGWRIFHNINSLLSL